jgi:pyridoxine kinase
VQFSNHTGYPTFKGDVLQGGQLLRLLEVRGSDLPTRLIGLVGLAKARWWNSPQGLEANNLSGGYTHLLTGYIGSSSFLSAVVEVAKKLKVKPRCRLERPELSSAP